MVQPERGLQKDPLEVGPENGAGRGSVEAHEEGPITHNTSVLHSQTFFFNRESQVPSSSCGAECHTLSKKGTLEAHPLGVSYTSNFQLQHSTHKLLLISTKKL